jgi:hypothetical protein
VQVLVQTPSVQDSHVAQLLVQAPSMQISQGPQSLVQRPSMQISHAGHSASDVQHSCSPHTPSQQ